MAPELAVQLRPEKAAHDLLTTAWTKDADGGFVIPVDPISIAGKLGIKVFTADLGDGVSGMLVKEPRLDPKIYLRSTDSPNRQRFTCAHELGHLAKRGAAIGEEDSWEYIERRAILASQGIDDDEIFANQFGAALLMPPERVRELCVNLDPTSLAPRFGVSVEAMNYRLQNLRLDSGQRA